MVTSFPSYIPTKMVGFMLELTNAKIHHWFQSMVSVEWRTIYPSYLCLSLLKSENSFALVQLCNIIGHWLEMIVFGLRWMFHWLRTHLYFYCMKIFYKRVLIICGRSECFVGTNPSLQLYILKISMIMRK